MAHLFWQKSGSDDLASHLWVTPYVSGQDFSEKYLAARERSELYTFVVAVDSFDKLFLVQCTPSISLTEILKACGQIQDGWKTVMFYTDIEIVSTPFLAELQPRECFDKLKFHHLPVKKTSSSKRELKTGLDYQREPWIPMILVTKHVPTDNVFPFSFPFTTSFCLDKKHCVIKYAHFPRQITWLENETSVANINQIRKPNFSLWNPRVPPAIKT